MAVLWSKLLISGGPVCWCHWLCICNSWVSEAEKKCHFNNFYKLYWPIHPEENAKILILRYFEPIELEERILRWKLLACVIETFLSELLWGVTKSLPWEEGQVPGPSHWYFTLKNFQKMLQKSFPEELQSPEYEAFSDGAIRFLCSFHCGW